MADQAAKEKRKKVVNTAGDDVIDELADGMVDHLMTEFGPPTLETVEQQRQRRKLQVIEELEDFRASFSRGYAVILSELAKKTVREEKDSSAGPAKTSDELE